MYVPQHFRLPEQYVEEILSHGRAGNLITMHANGPEATFVPFFARGVARNVGSIDADNPDGTGSVTGLTLYTHLVRNNPQVRLPQTGPGMVIFDVTDAFVSPQWYGEDVDSVPTWDYITLHLHGRVKVDPDPAAALEVARELSELMGEHAALERVGQRQLAALSKAIVAVEVAVDRVDAKAKMSQNYPPDKIRNLIRHFREHGPAEVADYLERESLPHAEERARVQADLRERRR